MLQAVRKHRRLWNNEPNSNEAMKAKHLNPQEIAAQRFASLNRRRFLRGLGASLALPAFQSLRPFSALADEASPSSGKLATSASGAPLRMAFVYFPNGAIQPSWWPKGEGKEFELGRTMQ